MWETSDKKSLCICFLCSSFVWVFTRNLFTINHNASVAQFFCQWLQYDNLWKKNELIKNLISLNCEKLPYNIKTCSAWPRKFQVLICGLLLYYICKSNIFQDGFSFACALKEITKNTFYSASNINMVYIWECPWGPNLMPEYRKIQTFSMNKVIIWMLFWLTINVL